MKPTDFAVVLQKYFTEHLVHQRANRENTIKSYRDTFKLFLEFMAKNKATPPDRMTLAKFTADAVEEFRKHLVIARKSSVKTGNQRLASIHSFVRFLQYEYPDQMFQWQRIQAIPTSRCDSGPVRYLTQKEMLALTESIETDTRKGIRDKTMIVLLYDTGARVQELVDLSVRDVRLATLSQVKLYGKGGKTRMVPLMPATAALLREYMDTFGLSTEGRKDDPLFSNRHGNRLTRFGITYLLREYGNKAREAEPSIPEKVTPHLLRHSKAMHLLEEGCSEVIVQHILGHANLKTTSIYARANTDMIRSALKKISNDEEKPLEQFSWIENRDILAWLKKL